MATIFLNCTKNTELTPPWFARTVAFVLSTKMNSNSIRRYEPDRGAKLVWLQPSRFTTTSRMVSAYESSNSLDHLSHPLFGQSQTAHHQPHLHRRSRPSTLRLQGRLPRRILRRRSPHRLSPDLRGCLCSAGSRARISEAGLSAATKSAVASSNPSPRPHTQALPCVPPCPLCLKPLTLTLTFPLNPLPHNCERPMNSSCGKQFRHPSIKPVIVEDTTHGVSLLTDTISGSNFAFP